MEVNCNAKLPPNYFSVNVSALAVVFCRQIKKKKKLPEVVNFLKFVGEIQQLVRKHSQKNNQDVSLHYISLPIYPFHFSKFRVKIKVRRKILKAWSYLPHLTFLSNEFASLFEYVTIKKDKYNRFILPYKS